jgi:phosphoribosyl 1,2-cyclic phosphodiesterase
VRLQYLGVRGSTPAPGADFVRYGGHTSCVAISPSGGPPSLVLDAGTGLRSLTGLLDGKAFEGSILVSHLHWDHVHGLPFFIAGDREDASVDLYLPAQDGASALALLSRAMSPPSFPITPDQLGGRWDFHALEPGTYTVEGLSVTAAEISHKGGRTFGYRIEDGDGSLAYLPDHAPAAGITEGALALARDVDVLLHDSQFIETERYFADLYGHATIDDSIAFAVAAGARSLVLFHHGPARTDDRLEEILAGIDAPLPVTLAREGDTLAVAPPPPAP